MIEKLIDKYKTYKKQSFLDMPLKYKKKYAFIGVGGHSISSLYPALMFLGVPISMIYSRSLKNAQKMALRFNNCSPTDNIESVINNKEIDAVFICLKADLHYELVKKCLLAGKNVFVEKPPCIGVKQLESLIETEKNSHKTCLVGLQRRYSKVYKAIKKQKTKPVSYNYKFYTGVYPANHCLYDLFIHPIDIAIYLFGDITHYHKNIIKNNKGLNVSLLTNHTNGCSGIIELSTMHSWQKLIEELNINYPDKNCNVSYPIYFEETKKSKQVAGMPLEKVIPEKYIAKKIKHDNNYINPVKENNSLFDQGFYDELNTFISIAEKDSGTNYSSLKSLKNAYKLINDINLSIS